MNHKEFEAWSTIPKEFWAKVPTPLLLRMIDNQTLLDRNELIIVKRVLMDRANINPDDVWNGSPN